MPSITREQTNQRIERDDGDLSDEVIPRRDDRDICCYHNDPNCYHVTEYDIDPSDTETRAWCQENGLAPCKRCVLGEYTPSGSAITEQLMDPDVTEFDDIDWEAV
jgi:hypothetical protein